MRSLFDPQGFYFFAGKAVKPLFVLAAVLAAVALYLGFFVCPIDATQGNSYRIIFIHVSSAWMSMLIYVLMAVFSAGALATNNRMCSIFAAAMAPTGALMCFLALFSGAVWGRPTWGAYWVWDARLTSELILLFLYLGFLALQSSIADIKRADKACALIALVGVVNVPIIYFSVRWWNTLHQGSRQFDCHDHARDAAFDGRCFLDLQPCGHVCPHPHDHSRARTARSLGSGSRAQG